MTKEWFALPSFFLYAIVLCYYPRMLTLSNDDNSVLSVLAKWNSYINDITVIALLLMGPTDLYLGRIGLG